MQKLDPISHPLNSVSLIEASAGTGKTYTMVALYLRLLLNAGDNGLNRPLNVEEILVMTFTKAATQELKDRIRSRIVQLKMLFEHALKNSSEPFQSEDQFINQLYQAVKNDLPSAILRLEIAQQNMDMAAIFTIHGFCQRVLTRYAFDSGVHFNLEMVEQQNDLQLRFCREYWREHYYPQNFAVSRFIDQALRSPQAVFNIIKSALSGEMPQVRLQQPELLQTDFNDFLQNHVEPYILSIQQLKQHWQAEKATIQSLIINEIKRKKDKRLDGRSYQERYILSAVKAIDAWAENQELDLDEKLVHYFSQQKIDQKTKNLANSNEDRISHPLFSQVDQLQRFDLYKRILLWHYTVGVRTKLAEYKATHKEMGFDDLLTRLKTALYSENGQSLAQLIRQQFPFAMVDEFQDTDLVQYQILERLYIDRRYIDRLYIDHQQTNNERQTSGMIMIGDPKQSIYAFRHADIFTYLSAAQRVKNRFTLDTNWRSTPALIQALNNIFGNHATPFIYPQIQFQAVNAGQSAKMLHLNGESQKPLNIILSQNHHDDEIATACAALIQQWLQAIEQQQCLFDQENQDSKNSLAAKDLAVLVRNGTEADKIKRALAELGIQSVYLSDRSSVLNSEWAQIMCYLLRACLNPHYEQAVMTLLATRLFHFTAAELSRLRQDEKAWEIWIERFLNYQRIWQTQGVLPMIHRLLQQQNLPQKLLAMTDGERAITDILHLAEFLQQGATINENEHALLSWFEQQINNPQVEADEVRLRLESERDLVKIVTVHKSKGLEYGVVWLPFVGAGYKNRDKTDLQRYHDSDNQLFWDLDLSHSDQSLQEKLAEELRLLYVALTRARYQLNIVFPSHYTAKNGWNPLAYLLSATLPSETETETALSTQISSNIDSAAVFQQCLTPEEYQLTALESLQADDWRAAQSQQIQLQAAEFNGRIENNWRISSFTALAAMNSRNQQRSQQRSQKRSEKYRNRTLDEPERNSVLALDNAQDYDDQQPNYSLLFESADSIAIANLGNWQGQAQNPFTFPHGMKVGNVLHYALQQMDFTQAISEENITAICRNLALDKPNDTDESSENNDACQRWQPMLRQWLNQIRHTPFLQQSDLPQSKQQYKLCLEGIAPQDCLKEMAFLLGIDTPLQVKKLNQLLQRYHPLAEAQTELDLDIIKGMLRGFIDLVCRIDGKYYLVDYKSNLLGEGYQAYRPEILRKIVAYHHYDLQYLIYTLALHRYLSQRDPNYDYQRDFGGVYYLFLRGLDGESSDTGIYFDKPQWQLIDGLDKLLAD